MLTKVKACLVGWNLSPPEDIEKLPGRLFAEKARLFVRPSTIDNEKGPNGFKRSTNSVLWCHGLVRTVATLINEVVRVLLPIRRLDSIRSISVDLGDAASCSRLEGEQEA